MKKAGIFILCALITTAAFGLALGEGFTKTIDVLVNSISIKVNGKPVTADNFVYEGRTYVQLREVGEMLGKEISWDGETKTANINDKMVEPQGNVGYNRTNPAPVGTTLRIVYEDIFDKFTADVTLEEIIRGDKAWDLIKAANEFWNDPPKEGHEYLLAKINFALIESDKQYNLSSVGFTLVSEQGKSYEPFIFVVAPDPQIRAALYAGASHEGWTVFEVEKEDLHPTITFARKYDGSGGIWFKAY